LVIAAGGTAGWSYYGAENLKSQSWDSGENTLGFSALPGGRNFSGTFYGLGSGGYWWTATEVGASTAYFRFMYTGLANEVRENDGDKGSGYSVRCVQD
jgi:uncharacterized protein (TIGR02145 family)